ncbi:MAG: right-handed parallel beta-helix repeat-containing protein [Candidatus Aenigmarchaeota archaeon]|nr:right-handed parallel beta-helix repeat-containing protein [Candidatus Aenigmarchaeota archaeon]
MGGFLRLLASLFFLLALVGIPASAQPCRTTADANCDGAISIQEMNSHIGAWFICSDCTPDLFDAIQGFYGIPFCGDASCDTGEDEACSSCPYDCGPCTECYQASDCYYVSVYGGEPPHDGSFYHEYTLAEAQALANSRPDDALTFTLLGGDYGSFTEDAQDRTEWAAWMADSPEVIFNSIALGDYPDNPDLYLAFDGIKVSEGPNPGGNPNHAVDIDGASHVRLAGMAIEGIDGHNPYSRGVSLSRAGHVAISGSAIHGFYSLVRATPDAARVNNVVISDCTFNDATWAVIAHGDDWAVGDNEFYDLWDGIKADVHDSMISENDMHDFRGAQNLSWQGDGIEVHSSPVTGSQPMNVTISGNTVNVGSGCRHGISMTCGDGSECINVTVEGNVVHGTRSTTIRSTQTIGLVFRNNTVMNDVGDVVIDDTCYVTDISRNIVHKLHIDSGTPVYYEDYNIGYSLAWGAGSRPLADAGGHSLDLGQSQAAFESLFTDFAGGNYTPLPTGPACPGGNANLSSGEHIGALPCVAVGPPCGPSDGTCPDGCHYPTDPDCTHCGDDTMQAPNDDGLSETCDGTDLDTYTDCLSHLGTGWIGALACLADCSGFDTSGCVNVGECGDLVDNDADGATDAADFSCQQGGPDEDSFMAECQNGLDDDSDTFVDFPDDPDCYSLQDNVEQGAVVSEGLVINHTHVALFEQIPDYWLEKAKELRVEYTTQSHGSQSINDMVNMESVINPEYSVAYCSGFLFVDPCLPPAETPSALRVFIHGGRPENYWETQEGRDQVAAYMETGWYNYSIFFFCGEHNGPPEYIQAYLGNMTLFEQQHPEVGFIYATGHSALSLSVPANNAMIRDYAISNNKLFFDFADIEHYDPDGNYYPNEDGTCVWCENWCSNHPADCQNLLPRLESGVMTGCPHAHGFLCRVKAKAFWVMLAMLAGWEP